jgi:hypothetical protein
MQVWLACFRHRAHLANRGPYAARRGLSSCSAWGAIMSTPTWRLAARLLQHSADLDVVTRRCSIRNPACPVNEKSQFHHSGKVGIGRFGGPIVASGQSVTP